MVTAVRPPAPGAGMRRAGLRVTAPSIAVLDVLGAQQYSTAEQSQPRCVPAYLVVDEVEVAFGDVCPRCQSE